MPDFSLCQARRFGGSDAVFCLENILSTCPHALMFNSGTFCLHPDREKFIARVKASMSK
jgi:hypothetical protein